MNSLPKTLYGRFRKVIEMVRYQIIRELHYNQGKSKRAIAQDLESDQSAGKS